MARGRRIVIEVAGDASSLERAFRQANKSSSAFGRSMSAVGKAAGIAGAAVGVGLAASLKVGIDEFLDSQKVAAQTAAVLKSTGGAAGITKKHVDRLAASLSKMSGVDDELVQSSENVLLTFTKIGKHGGVFDQATKAALDMSVALGTDLQSATIQIGKALNDPIKGITALRRVGVSFTAAQQDQIKTLVTSGHLLKAQTLILKELQTEFGGSAKAAGQTFAGSINKLKVAFQNLAGTLVGAVAPQVQKYIDQAVEWLNNTENQKRVMRDFKETLRVTGQVLSTLVGIAEKARAAFQRFSDAVGGSANAIKILGAAIVAAKLGLLGLKINKLIGKEGGKTGGGTGVLGLSSAFRFALPFAVAVGVGLAIKKFTPLDEKIAELQKKLPGIFNAGQLDPKTLPPKLQKALKNRPGDAQRQRDAAARSQALAGVRRDASERELHRATNRALRRANRRNRAAARADSTPVVTTATVAGSARRTVALTGGGTIHAKRVTVISKQPVQLTGDVLVTMDGERMSRRMIARLNQASARSAPQRRGRHGGISVAAM